MKRLIDSFVSLSSINLSYCQDTLQSMDIDLEAKAEALYQNIKAAKTYSQDSGLEYEKAVFLNPKNVGALWEAARYYDGEFDQEVGGYNVNFSFEARSANREKAIDCFRRIIELDPNFSEAYKRLAKYSQGILREYEKVLSLNPQHVGALWEAARYYDGEYDYAGQGSYWNQFNCANSDKARNYFKRIIELDPKFGLAYKRLAKYCSQDKEKALHYNLEYIHYFPQDYAVIATIGRQYHSLNRKQEAITSFKKCLQQNDKDQGALRGLAAVYEDQGNFKESLECLHKCMDINNKRPDTYAELAHVYDSMGNIKEATNYYRKCNQLNAGHKQANAYLKKHISKH